MDDGEVTDKEFMEEGEGAFWGSDGEADLSDRGRVVRGKSFGRCYRLGSEGVDEGLVVGVEEGRDGCV